MIPLSTCFIFHFCPTVVLDQEEVGIDEVRIGHTASDKGEKSYLKIWQFS
jgi:hypothetical protein